jgi:uncharacterized protein YecE (DUF72 family)
MEFGRVPLLDGISFELPPDHPDTSRMLGAATPVHYLQPQVYVGCPTWSNKAWLGRYYPAGINPNDHLYWYSRQFNTIELNTTHYRIPDAVTINRWRTTVPPDFTFCPKLPQVISHDLQLQHSRKQTLAFCDSLWSLKPHLGRAFLQLSPVFGPPRLDVLLQYLEDFPRDFPLALELRDAAWFTHASAFNELAAVLEAYNIALVLTDVAGRRDVLHMRLTHPTAFIRFVGYGLHATDYARIDNWVERLKSWFNQGLQTLFFFIHQENILHSPVLINYFSDRLQQECQLQVNKPTIIPQPVQGSLF